MRIVWFGSGDIGIPALGWLLGQSRDEVVGVVTQPDRAAGRGLHVRVSAIKLLAQEKGVRVLQPAKVKDPAALAEIADLAADLFVVMAYGQILPQALLDLPPLGAVNLHASLLPRHRGAAPVQAALLAGDTQSGVTAMWIDAGLDTGDILLQRAFALHADETAGSLHDRLAAQAPEVLAGALELIRDGRAPRIPQDKALATYAPKLGRESGRIDWQGSARDIARKIRALYPWPGSSAEFETSAGKRLTVKIHRAVAEDGIAEPGQVLPGLRIGCAEGGLLHVLELQPSGGRKMQADEFLRGHIVARAIA